MLLYGPLFSLRSERRLVAVVAVVRMQFQVRQRATETDQGVQQPGTPQWRQTLSGIGGAQGRMYFNLSG